MTQLGADCSDRIPDINNFSVLTSLKRDSENELNICGGGVYCLKLRDKEHSTQFIHLKPVKFSFFHLYRDVII
jgi:hypothetical protein